MRSDKAETNAAEKWEEKGQHKWAEERKQGPRTAVPQAVGGATGPHLEQGWGTRGVSAGAAPVQSHKRS